MATTILAALLVTLSQGPISHDSVSQEAAFWHAAAIEHEALGRFDEAVIARARGLVVEDNEQDRRELTRMTSWYSALEYTIRLEEPADLEAYDEPNVSAGGGRILTCWGELRVWDEETGELLFDPIPCDATKARIDPSGRFAAVWRPEPTAAWVVDLETGERLLGPSEGQDGARLRWGPGGDMIAWVEMIEGVRSLAVWDLRSKERIYAAEVLADGWPPPCFSHDGRYLAHGDTHTVKIHDLSANGGEPTTLPLDRYEGGIFNTELCFHPTEAKLAVSPTGDEMRVWDVEAGAWDSVWMMGNCVRFLDEPRTLAFDATYDRWVTASPWDVYPNNAADGTAAGQPLVPDELVDRYRRDNIELPHDLSHDGLLFAMGGIDDSIRVWNTRTGERLSPVLFHGPVKEEHPHLRTVTQVCFTPSGKLVSVAGQGLIRVWATAKLKEGYRPARAIGANFYVLPQGPHAMRWTQRGMLLAFDADALEPEVLDCPQRIDQLAVSGDGRTLAGIGDYRSLDDSGNGIWTWDLGHTAPAAKTLTHGLDPLGLALDHDGTRLATYTNYEVQLWGLQSRRLLKRLPAWVGGIAGMTTTDEATWAWGGEDDPCLKFDQRTLAPGPLEERVELVAGDGSGACLTLPGENNYEWRWPGGKTVPLANLIPEEYQDDFEPWAAGGGRVIGWYWDRLVILDIESERHVATNKLPYIIEGLTLNGDRLVAWDGAILYLIDAHDGRLLAQHRPNGTLLHAVGVPGTDRVIASVLVDEFATVNALTGETVGAATQTDGHLNHVAPACPGHAWVMEGSGALSLIELASGRRSPIPGSGPGIDPGIGPDQIRHAAISPDGSRMVSASSGGVVRLQDVRSGRELYHRRLPGDLWSRYSLPGDVRWTSEAEVGETQPFRASHPFLFDPGGTRVLVGGLRATHVPDRLERQEHVTPEILDARTGARICTLDGSEDGIEGARFGPKGKSVAGWRGSQLAAWETESGGRLFSVDLGQEITNVRIAPAGDTVTALARDGRIGRWSLKSGQPILGPMDTGLQFPGSSINDEGTLAFGTGADKRVRLIDLTTGQERHETVPFRSPRFGPKGLVLLRGSGLAKIDDQGLTFLGGRRRPSTTLTGPQGWRRSSMIHGFVDPWRAVFGAHAKNGEVVPNLLDFGPATDAPLTGQPKELLANWSKRLGLEISPKSNIIPSTPRRTK